MRERKPSRILMNEVASDPSVNDAANPTRASPAQSRASAHPGLLETVPFVVTELDSSSSTSIQTKSFRIEFKVPPET